MKKVTILGVPHSMATTIFGPMDILNQAGRLWPRVYQSPQTPFFDVSITSADGRPIKATNNILIQPHYHIDDIDQTDLIVIASATFTKDIIKEHTNIVPWLKKQYDQGAHIASICTGVFLLAETGLLDGKSATLHWGFTKMFKSFYPGVHLEQDKMFIDHGRLYCSAGVSAGMDLSLYLVEKFCGKKAAIESAKTMILDLGREKQTPYDSFLTHKDHSDPLIKKVQNWIEKHYTRTIDYNDVADLFNISRRSLERRFKKATAITLLGYLQHLRVEAAKRMLEEGIQTFNEITYRVGYEDIAFFRKLFIRLTGLRPKEYQQKFTGFSALTS